MQHKIFSLYNRLENEHEFLGVHSNEQQAKRIYAQTLFSRNLQLDREYKIALKYEEYELHELGEIDIETGHITPYEHYKNIEFNARELLGEVLINYENAKKMMNGGKKNE